VRRGTTTPFCYLAANKHVDEQTGCGAGQSRGRRSSASLFASLIVGLACLIGAVAFTATTASAQTAIKTTIAGPTDFTIGLIQASDGNFYSTSGTPDEGCQDNPANQCSFIYKITPDGTITTFHAFQEASTTGTAPYTTNADGLQPSAFFEGADGNFYGACESGGTYGLGTIFKIGLDGTFTVLYAFPTTTSFGAQVPFNGLAPNSLIQGSDGNLYGTVSNGSQAGVGNGGLFFQIQIAPSGTFGTFTAVHYFPIGTSNPDGTYTWPEGAGPEAIVQGDNGNFYITMNIGPGISTSNLGAINEVTPGGGVNLFFTFPGGGGNGVPSTAALVEGSDGSMYGTTKITLTNPKNYPSLVYKISPSGNFTPLHQFTGGSDGIAIANGGLFPGSDGNFYGVANYGGNTTAATCPAYGTAPAGCGTFYQLQPSGTLTTLYAFSGGLATAQTGAGLATADGSHPLTPIVQAQTGLFYGTTGGAAAVSGDSASSATVYSVAVSPALSGPIQLAFSVNGKPVTSVTPNTAATLNWNVLNAFSTTMQQCHASVLGNPTGAGNWDGPQAGSLRGNAYIGSATITPTAAGIYTYVLNCGGIEIGTAILSVSGVTINTPTLPPGLVSVPYNTVLVASGGVGPYTWGALSGLPRGLSVDAASGLVIGTPTQFGAYPLTIGVLDSSNPQQTASQTYNLVIASGLSLAGSLNNGVVGTAYNATAKATGGLPPYKWALASGTFPAGLTLNSGSGVITGTPTAVGKYTFSIIVTDGEPDEPATFTQSYTVSTAVPPLTIAPYDFPDCTLHALCQGQFAATGGTPPYTWSLAPGTAFLPGLTLSSNGSFTGLPTQYNILPPPGNLFISNPDAPEQFSVQVTDSETPPVSVTTSGYLGILSGLQIVSIPLPIATAGVPYQAPPPVATGGTPPYTWQVGFSASSGLVNEYGVSPATGAIYSFAGGPISVGTFQVHYTVTDSEGTQAMGTQATYEALAVLTVAPLPVTSATTLSSSNSTAGTGMPVTLTAKVTATGSVPSGTVTFHNGSAILGTATLDATGTATLNTSFSATGVYTLTASYAGAGTVTGSVSNALTETVVTPAVSASISPSSLTVASGSSGSLTLSLTPTGGYTGTVTFSCGTLPAHVSCTFAPPSLTIAASSGGVTDTLTINTAAPQAAAVSSPFNRSSTINLGLLFWLPGSLTALGVLFRRNRRPSRVRTLLLLLLVCLGLAGVGTFAGCGGASSQNAKAGAYTIPVTLTVAGGAAQTVSATITIQ
jgi:uncharacterized repeat protein (TIGR03803 family)